MSDRKQPNIILIMTDQQRFDTIGALGADKIMTPNIDRLVERGVSYEQCYCTAPSCVPSRASFFNLRYPHEIEVYHNFCDWNTSWVEDLNAAGYHTVNVGKMHTMPMDEPCGFDQRFVVENKDRPLRLDRPHGNFYDEWDKFLNNSGVRKPSRFTYQAEYADFDHAIGSFEWPLEEKYHPDIFTGNMAKWFIEQREAESPLFLQIGFPGPHPPYDPPQRFLEMYRDVVFDFPAAEKEELFHQPPPQKNYRQAMIDGIHDATRWCAEPTPEQLQRLYRHYAANITLIDEQIGEIINALQNKGYLENSIIVFTSDHGDCLGEHGHIQKWTMYDCITRVPVIVCAPGRLEANTKCNALIQQMDIVPMLFEFASVPLVDCGSAISALPSMLSSTGGRDAVFAEHAGDNLLNGVKLMTMIRTDDWKLVHYEDAVYGELYDLNNDPGEIRNLWDNNDYYDIKMEMLEKLNLWRNKDESVNPEFEILEHIPGINRQEEKLYV
jgi:arylsulfatase A-like enzyme